nr:protein ALP1-like [Tanacetum cinerariifolium]
MKRQHALSHAPSLLLRATSTISNISTILLNSIRLDSHDWRRLFEIRGPLVQELILEFFSTFGIVEGVFNLDTGTLQFHLGGGESSRKIINKSDLSGYWTGISFVGDFLGAVPFYTLIWDPLMRLCHRLIAFNINGRSQAPKKVTSTDLFYLRSMDVRSMNIPYLLAQYLRRYASERKRRARMSGGQFVWVAPRLLREQVAVAKVTQRMARLEEEVHGLRESLGEQRAVLDRMSRDFSRFNIWMASRLSQLLDASGVTYTRYGDYHIPYQRRTRQRTEGASTSASPRTDDHPDRANNDINVLDNSPLFDDLLNDTAPVLPYVVKGVGYEKGYYLTDGIYPQWANFVKSFMVANDAKHAYFKKSQEGAQKDVERAFGVLQGHQKMAVFDWNEVYADSARNMQRTWIERCETQRRKNKEMRDRDTHVSLQQNLMEHIWQEVEHEDEDF